MSTISSGTTSTTTLVHSGDTTGSLVFKTNDTGSGGTTAMTIDTSQNVGIGTSSPTQKLELNSGFVKVGNGVGGGGGVWFPYTSSDAAGRTWRARTDIVGYGDFGFEQSTTQTGTTFATKMLLDASGNLQIGTTNQSFKLSVLESNDATPCAIRATNASFSGQNILIDAGPAAGTGYNFITARANYNSSASTVFRVLGNGNVQNTNNSYGSLSDAKLKENIVDTSPKLEDLLQVKIRNFNLIGDNTKQIGVVAQELEQVFPSMVEEVPDRSIEGTDLGTTTKQVKYSVFVPILIKSIQELKALVDAQATEIAELKAKL